MSRRKVHAGSTAQTVPVFVQDSTSTTGAGLGSLVFNTSGLAAKYRREGDATWTTITLATATVGTWTPGGFVSDGGPVTGGYELGIPNAVLAAGAKWAEIAIYGAANMLAVLLEFELDTIDYQASGGKVPVVQLTASDFAAGALNGKGDWPTSAAIAAAVLTTQMTESYAVNGTAPSLAQAAFAIHQMLMDFVISGTTQTVKRLNNSTTAFIVTLNDSSDPTGAART